MQPEQSDSKSPRAGLAKEYFRNGQLCSVGHYADGKETGVWKYYLLNGNLKTTVKYSKDCSKPAVHGCEPERSQRRLLEIVKRFNLFDSLLVQSEQHGRQ